MSTLHIYTAPLQPATHFVDANVDPPMTITVAPRKLIYTECCNRRRQARYIVVQCYFDCTRRWCAPGRGCKGER